MNDEIVSKFLNRQHASSTSQVSETSSNTVPNADSASISDDMKSSNEDLVHGDKGSSTDKLPSFVNDRKSQITTNLSRYAVLNSNNNRNRQGTPDSNNSSMNDISFNLNLKLGKLKSNTNKANTGIGRDYWLDDSSATKCRACDKRFTTFLRKHHCRICGKIFCSNCTTFIDGTKFSYNGRMRVCLQCNNLADRYNDDMFSSDEDDDDDYIATNDNDASHDNNYSQSIINVTTGLNFNGLLKASVPYVPQSKAEKDPVKTTNNLGLPPQNFDEEESTKYHRFADDEDRNEPISFMNNHEFSWPNSGNSALTDKSATGNRFITPENNNPLFLKRADSFKSKNNSSVYSANFLNKPPRRRIASNRVKSRKVSVNFKSGPLVGSAESTAGKPSSIQFYDEFQRISEKYATSLLKELLVDKCVSNVESWSKVLIESLKKINATEIELRDSFDKYSNANDSNYNFSNYIKIKKIQGDHTVKSKIVEGIVFSKKLPIKTMPSKLENPKIMLITFPIEYDQDKDDKQHFQSLEAVIAQQDEYIEKLVDRILNSKPDVIVSSMSINGLALKLFADKNIAVLPDCKLSNLVKLSKFSDSTIITSIDILAMKPKLGTCGKFSSLSFLHENIVKSYIFFDDCPNKIGLTIILRDSNEETLSKIKSCLTIMMYVFANMKLESSFLRDQCLKIKDGSDIEFIDLKDMVPLYRYPFENYTDFINLVKIRLLSISPWVKFDIPLVLRQLEYLKSKMNENEHSFQKFKLASADERVILKKHFGIDNIEAENEIELLKLVQAIINYESSCLRVEHSFYMRKWEQFWRSRELTYFDPNYNQNIVVLFSQISKKNQAPCIGPEIQLIDFYWQSDFSLGQFIEHVCLNADTVCGNDCHLPLWDHYRSYVHNDGKVDVYIEPNELNTASDCIMTWSVCKRCKNSTAILPLNNTSFKYSFGKYLELIFWFNKSFNLRILNNKNNCQCESESGNYDFFKECHHYFSFREYRVHFEYSRIENLKLNVPKSELFWNPVYQFKNRKVYFASVKEKSANFFDSVYDRLSRIKLDGTNLLPEDVEAGEKKLEELKQKTTAQKAEIQLLFETMQSENGSDKTLKLNVVLREIQELSSFWNAEFQTFAKTFLPSEKDIKKITAFQLDRLFKSLVGKDEDFGESSEEEEDSAENKSTEKVDDKDINDGIEEAKSSSTINEDGEKKDSDSSGESSERGKSLTAPKKHKSQIILNKINELNRQKKDALLSIESGRSYDSSWDEGKVKQLTNFFNTQEYFNQRQLEKEKIDKFNKYTPKVSSMKPRIEIYKNASDAVNEHNFLKALNDDTLPKETGEVPVVDTTEECIDNENTKENKPKEKNKDIPTEKVSLLKSLTHFWADRSATLWEPLAYPLSSLEHIFVDSDVIVREDEPSSIVAFCLSTSDYESKLNGNTTTEAKSEKPDTEVDSNITNREDQSTTAVKEVDLENILLKKGFHLKYQFEDGDSTFLCKIFFTQQFDALRRKCGVNENFIESLSRCIKWDSSGGKSGSAFLKTQDQRFIIKELSKAELEAFVHFAPSYFEYFAHVLFHDLPSVLVKIFGFYQIQVKNNLPNAKSYTMDILIMENLFYDKKIDRIFDLKGSMRNRHVEQTGKENEVLLDENMVEYIYESPLFVKENDKRLLRASLWNDTLFLEKMNVMDYSLVVGIDLAKDELVVGIIDCIRTFTWDKKLESWVKEKGLVGNSGVGKEPTVITPKLYKNRFREAMERYILMSPGAYYQGTTNTNSSR